jgi:hypothetical protein
MNRSGLPVQPKDIGAMVSAVCDCCCYDDHKVLGGGDWKARAPPCIIQTVESIMLVEDLELIMVAISCCVYGVKSMMTSFSTTGRMDRGMTYSDSSKYC